MSNKGTREKKAATAATKPAGSVDVEVTRVEHYACGCTTTRIQPSRVARKWLLRCAGHGRRLVRVETVMAFELPGGEQA